MLCKHTKVIKHSTTHRICLDILQSGVKVDFVMNRSVSEYSNLARHAWLLRSHEVRLLKGSTYCYRVVHHSASDGSAYFYHTRVAKATLAQ